MGKWEANLPDVLIPEGEICVNVKIPNHPDYVKLFVRAMRMLEVNRMYQRDEEHSAAVVCEQWRTRTLTPLIEALATGNGCPEDVSEFDCIEYPAYASFIEFVPDNPYDPNAPIPNNYLTHAWWRWGKLDTVLPDWIDNPIADFIEDLTQYQENDAITWLGSLPYNGLGEIIDNAFPFPYAKIHVTGKGSIRLNVLSFPFGGRIFAEVDEIPNIIDILTSSFLDPDSRVIDTDRDVTTFPMEQWPLIGVKLEIPEEGDHIVYVMLMPKIEAGVDFFGFGGGLRSVELCNGLRPINIPPPEPPPLLEGVEELKPEFQFTAECGLEYRLRDQEDNIVQDWQVVAGWDENFAACVTGGLEMPTVEEICEGMLCAMEKGASRFLSGVAGNTQGGVTINPDGTIVVGGGDLPTDDPATEWSETEAAIMGAAINISKALEVLFDKIDNFYGPTNGDPVLSDATATLYISLYFPVDATAMATAIADYYLYRETQARLLFDTTEAMQNVLYCQGADLQGWNKWLIDYSGYASGKLEVMSNITNALAQKFWEDYYTDGLELPSTQYLDAPCVPIKEQTLEDLLFAVAQNTTILKANHRMLMIVDGYATDTDGDIQDWFWYNPFAAGSNVFTVPTFTHAAGANTPSQTEVPYNDEHHYEYTIDLANLTQFMAITLNKHADMLSAGLVYTEPFTITLKDLGQHTII